MYACPLIRRPSHKRTFKSSLYVYPNHTMFLIFVWDLETSDLQRVRQHWRRSQRFQYLMYHMEEEETLHVGLQAWPAAFVSVARFPSYVQGIVNHDEETNPPSSEEPLGNERPWACVIQAEQLFETALAQAPELLSYWRSLSTEAQREHVLAMYSRKPSARLDLLLDHSPRQIAVSWLVWSFLDSSSWPSTLFDDNRRARDAVSLELIKAAGSYFTCYDAGRELVPNLYDQDLEAELLRGAVSRYDALVEHCPFLRHPQNQERVLRAAAREPTFPVVYHQLTLRGRVQGVHTREHAVPAAIHDISIEELPYDSQVSFCAFGMPVVTVPFHVRAEPEDNLKCTIEGVALPCPDMPIDVITFNLQHNAIRPDDNFMCCLPKAGEAATLDCGKRFHLPLMLRFAFCATHTFDSELDYNTWPECLSPARSVWD